MEKKDRMEFWNDCVHFNMLCVLLLNLLPLKNKYHCLTDGRVAVISTENGIDMFKFQQELLRSLRNV